MVNSAKEANQLKSRQNMTRVYRVVQKKKVLPTKKVFLVPFDDEKQKIFRLEFWNIIYTHANWKSKYQPSFFTV